MLMRMFVANGVARLGGWLDWVAKTLGCICHSNSWLTAYLDLVLVSKLLKAANGDSYLFQPIDIIDIPSNLRLNSN